MSTLKFKKKKTQFNSNNENKEIQYKNDNLSDDSDEYSDNKIDGSDFNTNFGYELKKGIDKKEYIYSLFPKKLFAELYFAWCKDCSENITFDNAKYFRDEILLRNNRDNKNFNFNSLRVGKNFLLAFIGNLDSNKLNKINLSDNLITDVCMHNVKNIIVTKKLIHLNLASNMISSEGLKIIQKEVIESESLKYLNVKIEKLFILIDNIAWDKPRII